ncbi:hypothetical protein GGX14DRAFT_618314 [Mycena pura]|uniref:Uncharacterized protein n=1 Tax=Mycena pura TaxID=153505 RepID=A0AAD6VIV2_9AGAR|nr:hypothetical protein GGX14DRAFT_618314 [Mycena pura]
MSPATATAVTECSPRRTPLRRRSCRHCRPPPVCKSPPLAVAGHALVTDFWRGSSAIEGALHARLGCRAAASAVAIVPANRAPVATRICTRATLLCSAFPSSPPLFTVAHGLCINASPPCTTRLPRATTDTISRRPRAVALFGCASIRTFLVTLGVDLMRHWKQDSMNLSRVPFDHNYSHVAQLKWTMDNFLLTYDPLCTRIKLIASLPHARCHPALRLSRALYVVPRRFPLPLEQRNNEATLRCTRKPRAKLRHRMIVYCARCTDLVCTAAAEAVSALPAGRCIVRVLQTHEAAPAARTDDAHPWGEEKQPCNSKMW